VAVFPVTPQPALLRVWRIYLALIAAAPAFVASLFFNYKNIVWIIVTCGWLAFFFAGYLWYLPARFHKLSYRLDGDKLVVRHGVLVNHIDYLPLHSIQFTSSYTNPLSGAFGLSTLIVTAAGGRLVLPGLISNTAQNLAATLPQHWGGHAGNE